jgi:hypothetical protein
MKMSYNVQMRAPFRALEIRIISSTSLLVTILSLSGHLKQVQLHSLPNPLENDSLEPSVEARNQNA